MKKLLITSMAAVAIGLYAKAEDTGFISGTSFEEDGVPNAGESYFAQPTDSESYTITDYWTWEKNTVVPSADEGLFTVTNVNGVTYPSRPAHWAEGSNNKALAIDTGIPLLRNVNQNKSSTSLATAAVFFDSVVQFTATEAAPTPDSANGDKLMVWLYASDDVDNDNPGVFGETTPITNLVITAGYGEDQIATNYLTNLEVVPETWHRLTIKALNDIDPEDNVVPGFEVRLDGVLVSGVLDYQNNAAASVTTFPSLMVSDSQGNNKIIGVAFDGKGLVDDLVFTTTDPFDEDDPVVQNFTIKLSEKDDFWDVSERKYSIDNGEFVAVPNDLDMSGRMSVLIPTGSKKVKFAITMGGAGDGEEYTITAKLGETDLTVEKDNNNVCNFEIDVENTAANVELLVSYTVVKVGGSGGSDVEYPTVVPEEGAELTIPLSSDANTVIEDAFAGMTADDMPEKLTVVINEQEYKNDAAIQMINDVVDMFELSDGNKYFDNNGLMKVSFKATNPLLDAETADAEDYEAKVGEATATVRATYTVKKQPVDLTPDVSGENEPVIFKLVIKPAEEQ